MPALLYLVLYKLHICFLCFCLRVVTRGHSGKGLTIVSCQDGAKKSRCLSGDICEPNSALAIAFHNVLENNLYTVRLISMIILSGCEWFYFNKYFLVSRKYVHC